MNKVILIGFTGKDPETISFDKGSIVKVSLATNEYYNDASGNKKTVTTWHNLVFHGKLVEVAEKYIKKGNMISVVGKINNREYVIESGKKHITEIDVDILELLSSKGEQETSSGSADRQSPDTLNPIDDDLPF